MPFSPAAGSRETALDRAMLEAAVAGAREVMAIYDGDFAVQWKRDGTPVSEADRRSERVIVARLGESFPDVPIIAEEAFAAGAAPCTEDRFFLVDPLDGTKEFMARNGEFTVNIALIEAGVPVAGVVLAPATRLIYAGSGHGAWKGVVDARCNAASGWAPIRTRPCAAPPVAVASRSHLTPATEAVLRQAGVGETCSIGSSLKFCLLAEGAADFYPRLGPTMQWDTAAGDAVLRAAGGAVVTLDGAPLCYGMLAAPGTRDFESPHFLAAGDPEFLQRLTSNLAA
jgi:3'(2'),5'-bisphosphate nucleotidase